MLYIPTLISIIEVLLLIVSVLLTVAFVTVAGRKTMARLSQIIFSKMDKILFSIAGYMMYILPFKYFFFSLDWMALFPIISGFYACILLSVILMYRNENLPNIKGFIVTFIIVVLAGCIISNFILPGLIAVVSTFDFTNLDPRSWDFRILDLSLFGYIALPAGVGIMNINTSSPLCMDGTNQGTNQGSSSSTINSNNAHPATPSDLSNLSKPQLQELLQSNKDKADRNLYFAHIVSKNVDSWLWASGVIFQRFSAGFSTEFLSNMNKLLAANTPAPVPSAGNTGIDVVMYNLQLKHRSILEAKYKLHSLYQATPYNNTAFDNARNNLFARSEILRSNIERISDNLYSAKLKNKDIVEELSK